MKMTLTVLTLAAIAAASFVGPAAADDKADVPSFKKRPENEKEFIKDVGTAVVKAVRSSPAKLELGDYKITDKAANRKLINITMNWAGAVTGKKFKSDITVTVDPTDKEKWEVIDIDYKDDNPLLASGKAEHLNTLRTKFNR